MDNQYTDLCKRIRLRCKQNHWYGPDEHRYQWHTAQTYDATGKSFAVGETVGIFDYRGYIDEDGKIQMRPITHDARTGFEFPPATEEQVQATEKALDIPLLPVLRTLYTQVANGGFGPTYGITGIRGGYYFGDDGRYWTIDEYTDNDPSVEYIDLPTCERPHNDESTIELLPGVWPSHFLHFCYVGCGIDIFVDGKTGKVYSAEAGHRIEGGYTTSICRLHNAVENWLECWLRDEKSIRV